MRVRIWHRAIPGSLRGVAIETATVLVLGAIAMGVAFVLTRVF